MRAVAGLIAIVLSVGSGWAGEPITQADLLRRVIDLERLTTPPPKGERTGMFSSYDRRSRIDDAGDYVDWDANHDRGQFLGTDDEGWDVMARIEGPGALTRIWSADPHGQIRFVLDGETVIDTTFDELMSGRLAPFQEPLVYRGLNCYFPIGFSESCRVVCRESTSYYQINYVQFQRGTRVQRFTSDLNEEAQAALEQVRQAFERGLSDEQLFRGRRMMPVAVQQELRAGDVLSETMAGAGTVRALYVALTDKVNPRDLYALHRLVLRIYVDGKQTPNVEVPLIDFFGSGFDLVRFNSLVAGTYKELRLPLPDRRASQSRFMYCHFPMPYRQGLRLEIENLSKSKKKIGLLLHMRIDLETPPRNALRFHARYRREDPCAVFDYPILEATGGGRLVGCVLNVDCPRTTWWGEGDEKVWIDGERFPSYFGTGSADYLGDARGLHAHIRPLQGVTRSGSLGKNSAYRWHIPDCIDFRKSLRFTIENRQPDGVRDTYYSTVVCWYAGPRAEHFFEPLTRADLQVPGLRIPGAVEIEGNVLGSDWGNDVAEKHSGGVEFSGGKAAVIATEQPVQVNLNSATAQRVLLKLRVNPRRPFETIHVSDASGQLIGVVQYDRHARGMYTVGPVELERGRNHLTLQCTRPATLDCWLLE